MDLRDGRYTSPSTPATQVFFDTATPTTGGVIFDPNTPALADTLYVSSLNGSTWIYQDGTYITYTAPVVNNTEWYITGTTIDAGGNKTTSITRNGVVLLDTNQTGFGMTVYNNRNSGASNGLLITRGGSSSGGYGLQVLKGSTNQLRVNNDGSLLINDAYTLPTTDGTANYFLKTNGSGTVTWGVAGLSYFTEAQSTASPNATVNVDSLTAVASTTNADFAIIPKGTGAIISAIPDSLAAGGNKRGANAVDLQTTRNQPTNVASGSQSVVLGGYGNTASAANSTTLGGYFNTASGAYSVACNFQSQAKGQGSFAGGNATTNHNYDFAFGDACVISAGGYYANVCMGYQNSITSGLASTVFGNGNIVSWFSQFAAGNNHRLTSGLGSVALGVSAMDNGFGRSVYGRSGWVRGDTQSSKIILNRRTTDATSSVLVIDSPTGNTPAVGNQITLQNNNVFRIKGTITGKQSGSTNVGVWDVDCVIVRGANAASTVIAGSANVNLVVNTGTFGTPTLTANTTLGCLTVTVIGVTSTNIQWTCAIDTAEVIYA